MPELQQVIGAILRDTAQARVYSDMFARDISRQYERDPIMIHFPVPRSEIRELSFELKFAIRSIQPGELKKASREALVDSILNIFCERCVKYLFNELNMRAAGDEKLTDALNELNKIFSTTTFVRNMQTQVAYVIQKYTQQLASDPMSLSDEQIESIVDEIKQIYQHLVYDRIEEIAGKVLTAAKTQVTINLGDSIRTLREDIDTSFKAAEDFILEVDVTSDTLQALPESALSSIRLTTELRNYTWSQVSEIAGEPVRTISPE